MQTIFFYEIVKYIPVKYCIEKLSCVNSVWKENIWDVLRDRNSINVLSCNSRLLIKFIDMKIYKIDNRYALLYASKCGNLECMKQLLCKYNYHKNYLTLSLKLAIKYKCINIIKYLIDKDIQWIDHYNRIMAVACRCGDVELVNILLNSQPFEYNPYSKYKFLNYCKYIDIIKIFIEHGYKVSHDKYSILHDAIVIGSGDIIKLLLNYNIPKKYLNRSFIYACKWCKLDIVKILINCGIDLICAPVISAYSHNPDIRVSQFLSSKVNITPYQLILAQATEYIYPNII